MTTPRYLLAKYIRDLQRLEPRNVGVIVWSPVGVEARFLAEKSGRAGDVDGRSIPSFVTSASAYRQWIRFWRSELEKDEIEPFTGGEKVSRRSPEFLAALETGNKGNFVLAKGGFLLDPVDADQLPELADRLFSSLVESSIAEDSRDPTLDEVCERAIEEAGLKDDPHFHWQFELHCPLRDGTEECFQFSHAYRNGALQRLYQRVPLSSRKTILRKTIHDSAWMFERVVDAGIIQPEQGAALVFATPEQQAEGEVDRALRVLASVTRVLNLIDYQAVQNELRTLPDLLVH